MTLQTQKMEILKKMQLKDLNEFITCTLCKGYLVDATTIVDCLDVFCRGCILRHFEYNKTECPKCNTVIKKKSQSCFRADPQIQSLVYKLVPKLYAKEMQRREDFYRSTGVRANSSCSDDSVLERERDMINDQEEMISKYVGDKTQFFSPDDSMSLSLEYYQLHLDNTTIEDDTSKTLLTINDNINKNILCENGINKRTIATTGENESNDCIHKKNGSKLSCCSDNCVNCDKDQCVNKESDKRFLQCPAAVSIKLLQKFIRMKYGLTDGHKVDIIYNGEVLPLHYTLMDVAYIFKWTRIKPLRFFYRIFTPLKIQPIKIINTKLSTGGKQLQIVPIKPSSDVTKTEIKSDLDNNNEETEDQKNHKERLFAHLQLQSKNKVQNNNADHKKVPEKPIIEDCVFDYNEQDKEEIKRFAEKRDREWAMMKKKLDENRTNDFSETGHHFTKKRKKNKHSKNESVHKKRKLHAEITSNEEEDLKLKVKITPHNGHKHKHHKNNQSNDKLNVPANLPELSTKEKLLQMRQVRHKQVQSENKKIQTVEMQQKSTNEVKEDNKNVQKIVNEKTTDVNKKLDNGVIEISQNTSVQTKECNIVNEKPVAENKKLTENHTANPIKTNNEKMLVKPIKSIDDVHSKLLNTISTTTSTEQTNPKLTKKVVRNDNLIKSNLPMGWNKKVPTVKIERNEQTEIQAKKTFLKTFQSNTDKINKTTEKIQQNKIEKITKTPTINNTINTNNKILDRKIANLQQHCTIETKLTNNIVKNEKAEKKVSFIDKPITINPQYPPGFTVSKIETGIKRKAEDDKIQDKRPSLEITLINPPTSSPTTNSVQTVKSDVKPVAKRPPPATIPLERIKKSVNLKSGISIIPKMERCDNIGALDLSNKSPDSSPRSDNNTNGLTTPTTGINRQNNNTLNRPTTTSGGGGGAVPEKNIQLSNLQMLSKVASEHPNLNKLNQQQQQPNNVNKVRPQMPNLQTIKIPLLQHPIGMKSSANLQKLPKLNEIQKFRSTTAPQIRNLRPNQNQNIRNIPNPSLLIRQQNQNRLNSISGGSNVQGNGEKDAGQIKTMNNSTTVTTTLSSVTTTASSTTHKESVPSTVKNTIDIKVSEKKEISV